MIRVLLSALLCGVAALAVQSQGPAVGVIVVGRDDVGLDSYSSLTTAIRTALAPDVSIYVDVRSDLEGLQDDMAEMTKQHGVEVFFLASHGMQGAGQAVQKYARENPKLVKGVILLAGFLQRTQRPDIRSCLEKASIKPKRSIKYPGGHLEDGVHECLGPNVIDFPVPSLTLGGELDGVVRMTRLAEASYTQTVLVERAQEHPVVLIPGMNHSQLLLPSTSLPSVITSLDLPAEIDAKTALTAVANTVRSFVLIQLQLEDPSAGLCTQSALRTTANFKPLFAAFVEQEGSYFFTGGDEEHGSSRWSASAQELVVLPMPAGTNYSWSTSDNFRLLSDENKIPPYFRPQHRPRVNVSGTHITTKSVCQPRYIEISVLKAGIGLNGGAIIQEEKLNILTALGDTGEEYVSALELATKLNSRQLVYNRTGHASPASLDDGDRCAAINKEAYNWALGQLTDLQRTRFEKFGTPMVMGKDIEPFPPAGPWFIWNYLKYEKQANAVEVSSYYAFYALDANPYGAGNHYCKLLSPARALEWMLVDGLRSVLA